MVLDLETGSRPGRLGKLALAVVALVLAASACGNDGNTGFTQVEIEEIVEVDVADAWDDFASATRAQEAEEEAAKREAWLAAKDECGMEFSVYVIADETGIELQGADEFGRGHDFSEIRCVLRELDIPDSLLSRMTNTTSLMGIVEGQWDVYKAEWTYHPDNGLNVFVTLRD